MEKRAKKQRKGYGRIRQANEFAEDFAHFFTIKHKSSSFFPSGLILVLRGNNYTTTLLSHYSITQYTRNANANQWQCCPHAELRTGDYGAESDQRVDGEWTTTLNSHISEIWSNLTTGAA